MRRIAGAEHPRIGAAVTEHAVAGAKHGHLPCAVHFRPVVPVVFDRPQIAVAVLVVSTKTDAGDEIAKGVRVVRHRGTTDGGSTQLQRIEPVHWRVPAQGDLVGVAVGEVHLDDGRIRPGTNVVLSNQPSKGLRVSENDGCK